MLTKILIPIVLCIIGVTMADISPVFVWGVSSPSKPALGTVMQEEFAKLMEPLIKDRLVVAFLEENLTAEDFLCSQSESTSCFAHLKGVSPKTYYNSVENPIDALRAVAKEREFNSVYKSGKLSAPVTCGAGKVVFITFDSGRQQREATLEEHDDIISAVSKKIDCAVVYMYLSTATEAVTLQHRVRRATTNDNNYGCLNADNQFKICYSSILVETPNEPNQTLKPTGMTITNFTNKAPDNAKFGVRLATNSKSIKFNISQVADGYFSMGNVVIGNDTFHTYDIEAPTDFSFACENLTLRTLVIGEPTKLLYLNSLQFQAPFNAKYKNDFDFGDPWNCVGFFTNGILSGLFVVTLLLIIFFSGLCWMMDINTMDRFDDPKGKTISITATD